MPGVEFLITYGLPALFLNALLAATLLPFSSEALLAAMALSGQFPGSGLWAVATAGNVAGALLNWGLGRWLGRYQGRRWFPFSLEEGVRAGERFRRYGGISLLFSWLPVVGDPLTFVAGVLGYPLPAFLFLVAIGKAARYGGVLWFTL